TWHDLTDGDARASYRAMWTLTAVPQQVLPFIREKLKPVDRIPDERMQRLLNDLDRDTLAVREQTVREFESLGAAAEPFLRRELKANHTLECRRRIERLVERLDTQPLPGISLANWRALELLEYIGNSEARELLKQLSDGQPAASLTEEAKAALERRKRLRE